MCILYLQCIYKYVYRYINIYIYTFIHIHVFVIYIYVYVYMYICICICINICICIYIHIHVYMFIQIHIYIYINIYIHLVSAALFQLSCALTLCLYDSVFFERVLFRFECLFACVSVCLGSCVCVCVFVYVLVAGLVAIFGIAPTPLCSYGVGSLSGYTFFGVCVRVLGCLCLCICVCCFWERFNYELSAIGSLSLTSGLGCMVWGLGFRVESCQRLV